MASEELQFTPAMSLNNRPHAWVIFTLNEHQGRKKAVMKSNQNK